MRGLPAPITKDVAALRAHLDAQEVKGEQKINTQFRTAGHVDLTPFVYTDQKMTRQSVSFRVSDHFPLWAEFGI